MSPKDDKPLDTDEFIEWLGDLANELTAPQYLSPRKSYYAFKLEAEVLFFEKNDWDMAETKIRQSQDLNWDV